MKCPYCGAEVLGRFCEYCDSEVNPLASGWKSQSTPTIRALCEEILVKKEAKENTFASMLKNSDGTRVVKGSKINKRLLDTLNIPEQDSIYLIHDDTLFHSGKNGFAITSSGIFTKVLGLDLVYMSWEEFANAKTITEDGGWMKADNMHVGYYTTCTVLKEPLFELYKNMQEMIRALGTKALD